MAFDPDAFLERTQAEPVENTVSNPPAAVRQETGGFDPDQFLKQSAPSQASENTNYEQPNLAVSAAQSAAPAAFTNQVHAIPRMQPVSPLAGGVGAPNMVNAYEMAPTGFSGSAVRETLAPFAQSAIKGAGSYLKNPLNLLADIGLASTGWVPPGVILGKKIYDQYGPAKEALDILKKKTDQMSQAEYQAARAAGTIPKSMDTYMAMRETIKKINPELYETIGNAARAPGAPFSESAAREVVQNALKNPEMAKTLTPQAIDEMRQFISATGTMAKTGRVLMPLVRGAARVAGPVGLAMNAYDAAQYAQESGLGQRLAEGQGQRAEQAFRQHNTQYGAPISPEEAQAVLQSGSPRDIEGLGGQEFLNSVIRQQAAAQALKPVRPQQLPQGQ